MREDNLLKRARRGILLQHQVFFQNPASFEIMMMATSRAGITEAQTLEEFGKKGLSILKELLEKGILKKEGEKIYIDGTINAR